MLASIHRISTGFPLVSVVFPHRWRLATEKIAEPYPSNQADTRWNPELSHPTESAEAGLS